jgi:hypothetical protein
MNRQFGIVPMLLGDDLESIQSDVIRDILEDEFTPVDYPTLSDHFAKKMENLNEILSEKPPTISTVKLINRETDGSRVFKKTVQEESLVFYDFGWPASNIL